MVKIAKAVLRKLKSLFKKDIDKVLKRAHGVVHVGANIGQEIELYRRHGLSVIWIEPIIDVFETLKANLKEVPNQIALNALVTNVDDKEYIFNISNKNGVSSSILDFDLHKDIWPDIKFEKTVQIKSKTLGTLLTENNLDIGKYDMLIMDTQGSELLVLEGALPVLHNFNYIKTEAADFESYKGCCQIKDLDLFLSKNGFKEVYRSKFASHPKGGNYYDVMFKKV